MRLPLPRKGNLRIEHMDSVRILARSAALLEEIARGRAGKQRVLEASRAESRRSHGLGEAQDLKWTEPIPLEVALRDALRSTKECTAAFLAIVPVLPQRVRGPGATIFGAASVTADRLAGKGDERAAMLALCVRIIDLNVVWLDDTELSPDVLRAAVVARKCRNRCRQALAALCLSREDLS